jgi:hypothetical protein
MILTEVEIEKIRILCFNNTEKACAIAQEIINTCQIISCRKFAEIRKKSVRTIQFQSKKLIGIVIAGRKYPSLNQ